MFSFLGGLCSLVVAYLLRLPRQIAEELGQSFDGFVQFFVSWLHGSHDESQQAIGSARSAIGPPRDWLSIVRSFLRPTSLARVRVPSRRSIR